MRAIIITFIFMIICWGGFGLSFFIDRSRYRNCYILFLALLSVIPFVINVSGEYARPVMMFILNATILGLLIAPYFLIHNGFVMMKREGKRLPHLLSLLLGIFILLGELAMIFIFISVSMTYDMDSYIKLHHSLPHILILLFGVTIMYVSLSILIFVIYILLLDIIPWKKNFNYVIILGAGLIDGDKISKLLSSRLDKAITVYNTSKQPPKLIPSGGQGGNEKISEAEAMKRYLTEKGIPETDIIIEDKSTTTYENLTNSKKIIENRSDDNKTALVSSNYHVYRALRYCRKIHFKCTGIGSHTAFYYWPCAVIREYIAVHAELKHSVLFALGWIASVILALAFMRI